MTQSANLGTTGTLNTHTYHTMTMHDTRLRFDHVGIGVESVEDAEPMLRTLGCGNLSDEAATGDGTVPYTVVEALEAADFRVVYRESYDGWPEGFVSPRNATVALFQLMEYHEDYMAGRHDPETLFIGGHHAGADHE